MTPAAPSVEVGVSTVTLVTPAGSTDVRVVVYSFLISAVSYAGLLLYAGCMVTCCGYLRRRYTSPPQTMNADTIAAVRSTGRPIASQRFTPLLSLDSEDSLSSTVGADVGEALGDQVAVGGVVVGMRIPHPIRTPSAS